MIDNPMHKAHASSRCRARANAAECGAKLGRSRKGALSKARRDRRCTRGSAWRYRHGRFTCEGDRAAQRDCGFDCRGAPNGGDGAIVKIKPAPDQKGWRVSARPIYRPHEAGFGTRPEAALPSFVPGSNFCPADGPRTAIVRSSISALFEMIFSLTSRMASICASAHAASPETASIFGRLSWPMVSSDC